MKLLQQTGWYFLGFSLLVLLLGSVGVFLSLRFTLNHEMDESLRKTRIVLQRELSKRDTLPASLEIMDEIIELQKVAQLSPQETFGDTLLWVEEKGGADWEPYRQYVYTERIRGQAYRISLHHSSFENEHLLTTLMALIVGVLVALLLAINVFNRFASRRLWEPFYHTIGQIRTISFDKQRAFDPLPTKIEEFALLDAALGQMMEKMQQDYLTLKQFTENASHEMQTPLAIIRSQIELLQQRVPTDESVLQHLQHIQRASSKLSRLNQALLLLTRLDNQQYESRTEVQLAVVLNQQVEALQALIDAKSLQLTFQVTGVSLRMHPDLADLLVNNLLSNAIRHNQPGGQVLIELEPAFLRISNTGEPLSIPSEQMFARFSKGTHSPHSLGLGLSIVKEICEQYQWGLHYEYADAWHRVEVQVEKAKTKNS